MKLISAKELRKELGETLRSDELTMVTRRGLAVALIVPVDTEEGQRLLAEIGHSVFEGFISEGDSGGSGQSRISEEHDKYIYP